MLFGLPLRLEVLLEAVSGASLGWPRILSKIGPENKQKWSVDVPNSIVKKRLKI